MDRLRRRPRRLRRRLPAYAAPAYAAHAEAASVASLDALLDAWEEAVTKEGEDLYVPQAWEGEALAFMDEWLNKEDLDA